MRKFVVFAFAVAMFAGLSSCTKDYTCTCKYNDGNQDQTLVVPIEDAKKSDAEEACSTAEATYKIVDANASCTLN